MIYFCVGLDCDNNAISTISRVGGPNSCRVNAHSKPWVVRLALKGYLYKVKGHVCGGTLISKRHVLTALHCMCEINPYTGTCTKWRKRIAVMGDHDIQTKEGEQSSGFIDMKKHPNFRGM